MRNIIKVAMIEDDVYVRDLITAYIDSLDNMKCVLEADSVESFFEKINTDTQIEVLILDIGLPGKTGLEAISMVKHHFPNTDIIMFSVFDDSDRIFKALCAGVSGYLLKNTRLEELKKCIENVHNGQAAMSPSIAKKVIEHFSPAPQKNILTNKENMVVLLLTEGMSYKMIADRMQISMNTVRSHIRNIYKKLQVNSKTEVISKHLKGEIE